MTSVRVARDPCRVLIFDTTLRDGEQAPGCTMSLAEKVAVAEQLLRLGVDVIEAGFPAASRGEQEAVAAVAERIARADDAPIVCGLARAAAAASHSYVHRDVRSAPRAQATHEPKRGARAGR